MPILFDPNSQGSYPVIHFLSVGLPSSRVNRPNYSLNIFIEGYLSELMFMAAISPDLLNSGPGDSKLFSLLPSMASYTLVLHYILLWKEKLLANICRQVHWGSGEALAEGGWHFSSYSLLSATRILCRYQGVGPYTPHVDDAQRGDGIEIWQTKSFHQWLIQMHLLYEFWHQEQWPWTLGSQVPGEI